MSKYHINPETQRPNLCKAVHQCAYASNGETPPHFDNKEDARAYVEESSKQEYSTRKMGGLKKNSTGNVSVKETPDPREKLLQDPNPLTRASLAQEGYGLNILVHDPDARVRMSVANQNYGLDKLMNDPEASVRAQVAKNSNYALALVDDPDPIVRRTVAEYSYGNKEILSQLIQDPDPEVRREVAYYGVGLQELAHDENDEVRRIVAKRLQEQADKIHSNNVKDLGEEIKPGLYYKKDEYGTERYYNSEGKLHNLNAPAFKQGKLEEWYKDGQLHRVGKPAVTTGSGRLEYWQNGELHNLKGPAVYDPDGNINAYYINGKLHRDNDLPAIVSEYDHKYQHYQNGVLHRDNRKPAVFTDNGYREWRENGQLHNLNGPAIIHDYTSDKEPEYYIYNKKVDEETYHKVIKKMVDSGKPERTIRSDKSTQIRVNDVLHNNYGPSVIREDGTQEYYQYGQRHNSKGPAIVFPSGTVEYWYHGKNISKKEFDRITQQNN